MNFNLKMTSKERKYNQTPYSKMIPCVSGLSKRHPLDTPGPSNESQQNWNSNNNNNYMPFNNHGLVMEYEAPDEYILPKHHSNYVQIFENDNYNSIQCEPNDYFAMEPEIFEGCSTPPRFPSYHQSNPTRMLTSQQEPPKSIYEKPQSTSLLFKMPHDFKTPSPNISFAKNNQNLATPKRSRQTTLTSFGYVSPKVVINNAIEKASMSKTIPTNSSFIIQSPMEKTSHYFNQNNHEFFNSAKRNILSSYNDNNNNRSTKTSNSENMPTTSKYFQNNFNQNSTQLNYMANPMNEFNETINPIIHRNSIYTSINKKEPQQLNPQNILKNQPIINQSLGLIRKTQDKEEQQDNKEISNIKPYSTRNSLRTLSGPIDKILRWAAKRDVIDMLFEVVAPLVAIRSGTKNKERILLLQECAGTPSLFCVFFETDRPLGDLQTGSLVRCVGKMVSRNRMLTFSAREATPGERSAIKRLQFNCNRAFQDALQEAKTTST